MDDESNSQRDFKFLEHTADAYIEAYGSNLEEAYANAALAMFDVMTNTANVDIKISESIEVEGYDLKSLLYSWLESLLVKYNVENRLFSKFIIKKIKMKNSSYTLQAKVFGEDYNQEKHISKTEVKAVTYHLMEIEQLEKKYRLRFLLDL